MLSTASALVLFFQKVFDDLCQLFFFLTLHYIMCVWANNKPAPPSASQRSLQQRLAVPCLLGSVQEWLGNTNPWN